MNILIAIDSFKGSMSSEEASDAVKAGITKVSNKFDVQIAPVADGGEGTVEVLHKTLGGESITVNVRGPLFNLIKAQYIILPDETVAMDMASTAGLLLVQDEDQNPLNTTTFGVGEMIMDAIYKGQRNFIIGIGGSSTNDGGIGMLTALGYKFYDSDSNLLKPIGSSLNKIARIASDNSFPELKECTFTIACDVNNPLHGPNGAAYVYAKQKGANEDEIEYLDKGLKNFADVIHKSFGKDISKIAGTGAAGGLGGGFKAFLNAVLKPGIDIIFEKTGLEDKVKWADIIITGEGKLDNQTSMGKVVAGVANLGKKYDKKVIALAGSVANGVENLHDLGVTSIYSINDKSVSLEQAMKTDYAKKMLKKKVIEIFSKLN